jgi:hypothetical protein
VEAQMETSLQAQCDFLQLGIAILPGGICLRDVHPPLPVVDAFRDVSSAYKEMEQMNNEADTYRRDKLIQTGGEAVWRELTSDCRDVDDAVWNKLRDKLAGEIAVELNAARAFAVDREQTAAGEAAGFTLRQAAHSAAPELAAWRLFMDVWTESLTGKRKLILDRAATGRRQVLLGLPRDVPVPLFLPQEPERPPDDE